MKLLHTQATVCGHSSLGKPLGFRSTVAFFKINTERDLLVNHIMQLLNLIWPYKLDKHDSALEACIQCSKAWRQIRQCARDVNVVCKCLFK